MLGATSRSTRPWNAIDEPLGLDADTAAAIRLRVDGRSGDHHAASVVRGRDQYIGPPPCRYDLPARFMRARQEPMASGILAASDRCESNSK